MLLHGFRIDFVHLFPTCHRWRQERKYDADLFGGRVEHIEVRLQFRWLRYESTDFEIIYKVKRCVPFALDPRFDDCHHDYLPIHLYFSWQTLKAIFYVHTTLQTSSALVTIDPWKSFLHHSSTLIRLRITIHRVLLIFWIFFRCRPRQIFEILNNFDNHIFEIPKKTDF